MSVRTGFQVKYLTFFLIVVLLLLAMLMPAYLTSGGSANALSTGDWETVRSAIDGYISNQFVEGDEGEAGFTIDAGVLKTRLDSNNDWDGTAANAPTRILGEGDDASTAPVLVDNLLAQNNVIPGTSMRCVWNGTAANGCLETAAFGVIAARVAAHREAGFSTDVVVYCLTAHTEAPVTGGLGIISAAGGLGTPASRVAGLKWGRNGWTNTPKTYSNNNPLGSPSPRVDYALAGNPFTACDGKAGAELVRCTAAWAISTGGGNAGNGNASYVPGLTTIDVRTGDLTGRAIPGSVQIPIDSLFKLPDGDYATPDLGNVDPGNTPKHQFVSRTQIGGGIAAIGAEMLGYDSSFLQWGMPNYNFNLYEKQVTNDHPSYATISATVNDTAAPGGATTGVDFTPPGIIGTPVVTVIDPTTISVQRNTSEPATSKIVLNGSDGSTTEVNDTILNADKTVTVGGLNPGTTYTGTLTVFDGQANSTSTDLSAFFLPIFDPAIKPALTLSAHHAFWASYADYLARQLSVGLIVVNTGQENAYSVAITGSDNNNGVTLVTSTPIALGNLAAGVSTETTIVYNVPSGVAQFTANVTGSASDDLGILYTYP